MFDKKGLVLCADDFGLSPGIDLAILDLVRRGRLTAVSCMVAGSDFEAAAAELAALGDRAELGLHLTLTDLAPLGPMPRLAPAGLPPGIETLIRRALAGRLDYPEIKAEIGRQIDRFTAVIGRPPDFVDGHQHCHVLRTVRRALLDHVRERRRFGPQLWIRSCREPVAEIRRRGIEPAKTAFIALLSRGMERAARAAGAATNDSFRGVTAFRPAPPFRTAMQRFLTGPGRRPLVMCHPAMPGHTPDPTDTIMPAREAEYAYLAGDAFPADLDAAGIRLARFGELA